MHDRHVAVSRSDDRRIEIKEDRTRQSSGEVTKSTVFGPLTCRASQGKGAPIEVRHQCACPTCWKMFLQKCRISCQPGPKKDRKGKHRWARQRKLDRSLFVQAPSKQCMLLTQKRPQRDCPSAVTLRHSTARAFSRCSVKATSWSRRAVSAEAGAQTGQQTPCRDHAQPKVAT